MAEKPCDNQQPVIELPADRFARVLPLVPPKTAAGHMAFVHAVLAGTMPGRVFGDSVTAPRSAIVLNDSGFHFAFGDAPPALSAEELRPVVAAVSGEYGTLWATTQAWQVALAPLLAERGKRMEFHPPKGRLPVFPPLHERYRLLPIDEAIAAKFGGGTDPWVIRIWGGPERFIENCFGFAIMDGDTLASFCTACAIGGPPGEVEAEIEIGTDPRYSQQSLATVVALAFMAECRQRGLEPAWTCSSTNEASERLARRLGFTFFREVEGFAMQRDMRLVGGRWQTPREGE